MTLTVFILAGGESLRMGQDKGMMFGGVSRLKKMLGACGVSRIIILCGAEERSALFQGDVWPDPPGVQGIHHLISWACRRVDSSCLLLPCDAFLMTEEAFQALVERTVIGGVPLDRNGRRQPLFARIPQGYDFAEDAASVGRLLEDLPSVQMEGFASAFTNFNSAEDLRDHQQKLLSLHGEHVLQQSM